MNAKNNLKSLTYFEGSCHSVMVSFGETVAVIYLSTALTSGTTLGILTTLPAAVGAICQAIAPRVFHRASCATLTKASVLVQIAGLIAMSLSVASGSLSLVFMTVGLLLYWCGGMTAGAPWQEWISGLVPEKEHNVFFARRSAFVSIAMLASYLLVGVLLQGRLTPGWVAGLLAAAAVVRLASFISLQAHPLPRLVSDLPGGESVMPSSDASMGPAVPPAQAPRPLSAPRAMQLSFLCLFIFLFRAAVNVSAPFYNPYMLGELQLSLVVFAVLNCFPILTRVLFLHNWGRLLDQKRIYEGLSLCVFGIAVVPSLWTLSKSAILIVPLQIVSGLVWSGFELITVLLIQRLYPRAIMRSLAIFLAAGAVGGVVGGLVGGFLHDTGTAYSSLFHFSTIARSATGLALLWYMRSTGAFRFRRLEFRAGMFTVLSIRPSLDAIGRLLPLPSNGALRDGIEGPLRRVKWMRSPRGKDVA